jgi:hypothetical protein
MTQPSRRDLGVFTVDEMEQALRDLKVAEDDRYAALINETVDRYAALDDDRYAALRYDAIMEDRHNTELRYAALVDAVDTVRDYQAGNAAAIEAHNGRVMRRPAAHRKRIVHHRYISFDKPPPTGQLLWLTSNEYESCFPDDELSEWVWPLDLVVDFSDAARSRWSHRDDCLATGEEDPFLYAAPISSEAVTHTYCDCLCCSLDDLTPILQMAQVVRRKIAEDPIALVESMNRHDVVDIVDWAGLPAGTTPPREEMIHAIVTSPGKGLGGAALDWMTYVHAEDHGEEGERLNRIMDAYNEVNYLRIHPCESLLFYADDLWGNGNDGTFELMPMPDKPLHRIYGTYVTERVEYTSDPGMKVIAGWRSTYMRSVGTNVLEPTFDEND